MATKKKAANAEIVVAAPVEKMVEAMPVRHMPDVDLDHLFTFHPPTGDQGERYTAIRHAEMVCADLCSTLYVCVDRPGHGLPSFAAVNDATKAFAATVCEWCPSGADRSAAIRCVRLARNAMNEAVNYIAANRSNGDVYSHGLIRHIIRMAQDELLRARWQASAAVALGGS